MPALFSADSIGKAFGATAVLKAASVQATPGRITVLFGRNGCGKSTLLRIGAGVLAADHGAVHFDGHCYLRPRLHRLAARGLFYLPQDRLLTVHRTLAEHLAALHWRFDSRAADRVIREMGLQDLLGQRPHELSGGERRRAEVAIAWLRRPRCLLADEPLTGISPATAELVARALRTMAQHGCAIVVTGHEVPQLMELADDVVWMVAGTTHGLGTAADAARHDQFRREYLGPGRSVRPVPPQGPP